MKPAALAAIAAFLIPSFLITGCVTGRSDRRLNTIEAVLPAPLDKVQAALVHVLQESGYTVREVSNQEGVLSTGYREESPTIWNWLLVSRFGVGRSHVTATLTPESQETTRLVIHVLYEAKTHIWSPWRESTPPLPWNAETQLRQVKRVLGLL